MIAVQLRWLIIFYFNIKFLAQRDELSSVLSTVEAMWFSKIRKHKLSNAH